MTHDANNHHNPSSNNGRGSLRDLEQTTSPVIIGDQIVLPENSIPKNSIGTSSPTLPSKNLKKKYVDITIKDEESDKIVAYYNPPSLAPEYEKPQLIQLNWTTGFPMVNGIPFWERLPEEPVSYYEAFCHYRDQPSKANPEVDPTSLIRSLSKTANTYNIDAEVLEGVSELWMWNQRVDSYEQYAELLLQKHRANKIVVMESEHSKVADKLMEKAQQRLEELDIDKISPFVLLEFVRLSTEMKRLALRLNKEEPSDPNDKPGQNNDGNINLSGDNQKVQIILDRSWQSS